MSRTWFSFSLLLCDEIQTLYVTGCKVTPITGPAAPFRVYVLVKKLKNLVTAPLTEIRVKGYLPYQQGITYTSSSKAAKLVSSSSVQAAGKYRTIRFVALVPKCNALVLGSLPKQGRHPVCTSSDIGVGRRRYSRPYAGLDNRLIRRGGGRYC